MQFVSEKSKLYAWALQASSVKRYGITSGVISIVFVVWYFFVFQRIQTLSESHFNARTAQLNIISQRHRDQQRSIELNKKINELEKSIETTVGSHVQSDLFQSDIVNLISGGVQLRSYAPSELKIKQLYDKETVRLSFDATLDQLCNFFDNLQRGTNLLRCTQCVITCSNDTGVHTCSCTIERIRLKKVL